ncbi:hypothetical protein LINPERHAP1_LOCUS13997 [Linum perenne]
MAHPPLCKCHLPTVVLTSWTEDNPGRRFFSCGRGYEVNNPRCDFFMWVDAPIEDRAKQVINGLLRKLRQYERQMKMERVGMNSMNGSEQSAASFIGEEIISGKVEERKPEAKSGLYVMCVAVVVGVVSGMVCGRILG